MVGSRLEPELTTELLDGGDPEDQPAACRPRVVRAGQHASEAGHGVQPPAAHLLRRQDVAELAGQDVVVARWGTAGDEPASEQAPAAERRVELRREVPLERCPTRTASSCLLVSGPGADEQIASICEASRVRSAGNQLRSNRSAGGKPPCRKR